MTYKIEDCNYHNQDGMKTLRCPDCKECGEDIESRGDCKNLIQKTDGTIAQCMCYGEKHK